MGARPLGRRLGRGRSPQWCGASGQGMVETMISLTLVMMFIIALVHLAMLAVTRHVTNYAAFAGARVSMVGEATHAIAAAKTVTGILPWGGWTFRAYRVPSKYRVDVTVPFAYPLFNNAPGGRVTVRGEAPVYVQPNIREAGDNKKFGF